jgi:hypothetical protein
VKVRLGIIFARIFFSDAMPICRTALPSRFELHQQAYIQEAAMTSHIYRPEDKHPQPYQDDLNPDASNGINWGLAGPHPEKENPRTAKDEKDLHQLLSDFRDDELDQIVLLPAGSRLEANATYINLREAEPREFTAEGNEEVGSVDWIVPKAEVDYPLWNRLIGVQNPDRTGGRPR